MVDINKYKEYISEMKEAAKTGNYGLAEIYQRKANKLAVEYQMDQNMIWNKDYWITSITSDNFSSYEEARQDLLNTLKDLPGVEILTDKPGVKTIKVTSGWNVYIYEVRAHNGYEKGGIKIVKDLFTGEDKEIDDYKPIIYASLGKNIFKAKRNQEDLIIKGDK